MALQEFFIPYHSMMDLMCRVAVNQQILSEAIINLSKLLLDMVHRANSNDGVSFSQLLM